MIAAKGIPIMHVGEVEDDHMTGDEKFEDDSSAELDDAYEIVQMSFNVIDHWGKLKQNWILMENQSTVQMFSNKHILRDIHPATNPVDIHSIGGITHCNLEGTIPDIGKAHYKEDGLTNILSMALICDILNISYQNEDDVFTVHTPSKDIHFIRSRRGLYYHRYIPGYRAITMVQTVEGDSEGFTDHQVTAARQACCAYNMVCRPSPRYFEQMIRANMIKNCPITVTDIKSAHTIFGPDVGSIRGKTVRSRSIPVASDYIAILLIIMEQNSELDLMGDIFL